MVKFLAFRRYKNEDIIDSNVVSETREDFSAQQKVFRLLGNAPDRVKKALRCTHQSTFRLAQPLLVNLLP